VELWDIQEQRRDSFAPVNEYSPAQLLVLKPGAACLEWGEQHSQLLQRKGTFFVI
jgi:hypothetical protein